MIAAFMGEGERWDGLVAVETGKQKTLQGALARLWRVAKEYATVPPLAV